jgi:hypothetical protein
MSNARRLRRNSSAVAQGRPREVRGQSTGAMIPVAPVFGNRQRAPRCANWESQARNEGVAIKSGFQQSARQGNGFRHPCDPQNRSEPYTRTNNPGLGVYVTPKTHGHDNGMPSTGFGGCPGLSLSRRFQRILPKSPLRSGESPERLVGRRRDPWEAAMGKTANPGQRRTTAPQVKEEWGGQARKGGSGKWMRGEGSPP